jgi:hypothetical protein
MPKGKGTKRMSKKVSKKMVGGQIVPMGMSGMGVNQRGRWFWEQKDPIFGGFNKIVGKLFEGVKPSEIAKFAGKVLPLADTVGNLLGQAGLGKPNRGAGGAKPYGSEAKRRTQRGLGADSYHTSASMLPTTSPNTSNFGSVRF